MEKKALNSPFSLYFFLLPFLEKWTCDCPASSLNLGLNGVRIVSQFPIWWCPLYTFLISHTSTPHREQCDGETLRTWEKKLSVLIATPSFIIWYDQWPAGDRSLMLFKRGKKHRRQFFSHHLSIFSDLIPKRLLCSVSELTTCCVTQCLRIKVQKNLNLNANRAAPTQRYLLWLSMFFHKAPMSEKYSRWCTSLHAHLRNDFLSYHITHANQSICILFA